MSTRFGLQDKATGKWITMHDYKPLLSSVGNSYSWELDCIDLALAECKRAGFDVVVAEIPAFKL